MQAQGAQTPRRQGAGLQLLPQAEALMSGLTPWHARWQRCCRLRQLRQSELTSVQPCKWGLPTTENPATSQIRRKPAESHGETCQDPKQWLLGFPKALSMRGRQTAVTPPPTAARTSGTEEQERRACGTANALQGAASNQLRKRLWAHKSRIQEPQRQEYRAAWRGVCGRPRRSLGTGNDTGLHADAPHGCHLRCPPQAG